MKGFSKLRKRGFPFWNIFFNFRDIQFLYYANEESDDVIGGYNTQSRISLEILRQYSSNLAPEMYITKERKWHPSCRCHDNCYAAGPALIGTKFTRFYLTQGSSTPNNLTGRVKTIWKHVYLEQDPLFHFKRFQMGIFGLTQKETGAKSVTMATT